MIIFSKYYTSIANFMIVYPEKEWDVFKLPSKPSNFWNDTSNHKVFLDYFAQENNISSIDDWYKITIGDIKRAGGSSILKKYTSLYECLQNGM